MKVRSFGESGRSAGVPPAVAGASRSRAKEVSTSWKKARSKLKAKSMRAQAEPALSEAKGRPRYIGCMGFHFHVVRPRNLVSENVYH